MTILREQTTRRRLEMETRWKQGGLRPRVVHESGSEWIRRVDFQFPLAAMGTASGAVLVSECTDHSGSPDERRARSRRLVASMPAPTAAARPARDSACRALRPATRATRPRSPPARATWTLPSLPPWSLSS